MEDLLKRARSAGVGAFLLTQSPGDFDYKCKENVRTWLIGRVKEQRAIDKLKPMLGGSEGRRGRQARRADNRRVHLVRESSVTAVGRMSHSCAPSKCRRTRSQTWPGLV